MNKFATDSLIHTDVDETKSSTRPDDLIVVRAIQADKGIEREEQRSEFLFRYLGRKRVKKYCFQ